MQQLLEPLQGLTPLEGRLEPEGVVLLAPAVGEALSLSHRGKQLGVQGFVPEPAVERFGKAVLPRGTRLDVGRGCAAAPAHPDGQTEAAVLVNHVRELESAGRARFCWRGVGRCRPSSRQSRCTRLWFTVQSSLRSRR